MTVPVVRPTPPHDAHAGLGGLAARGQVEAWASDAVNIAVMPTTEPDERSVPPVMIPFSIYGFETRSFMAAVKAGSLIRENRLCRR
jgi:hypothetical protein